MKKIFMAIASVVLACGIGVAAVGCGAGEYIINVSGGGSGVGIANAQSGTSDLGMASEEVNGEEEQVTVYRLCRDGIAVIVNNDNTVSNLTIDQLKTIYTNEDANWSDFGGADADINVIHRENGSGTRSAFLDLIGVEDDQLVAGAEQGSTTGVLTTVAGDENAIGYISLGSLDDTVKDVTIGGVAATPENITGGTYELARPFNVMYQPGSDADNDLLADFLKYLGSTQAQAIIEEEGYISVAQNPQAYTVPETLPTTMELDVSGSTTVQPLMVLLAAEYVGLLNDALAAADAA